MPKKVHIVKSMGFPCGSAGIESSCNVGDLGLIPGLGRSPGEEKATYCSILAWRIPWTIVHGVTKSQTGLNDFHSILISAHINYAHFNVLQSYFLRFILLPLSTLLCVNLFSLGGLLICFILVYICRASHCCQCFFEIKS